MITFFLVCALAGAGFLVLQLLGAGLHDGDAAGHLGDGGHVGDGGHEALSHGLHLFSVRALTAGLAFFGVTGWLLARGGVHLWLVLLAAVAAALLAMTGVAVAIRAMTRLESDGTLHYANAVGLDGTVHVGIPADGAGAGKVMLTLQGRLVELPAYTRGAAISSGVGITVVDVRDDDVLEVRPANEVTLLPEV